MSVDEVLRGARVGTKVKLILVNGVEMVGPLISDYPSIPPEIGSRLYLGTKGQTSSNVHLAMVATAEILERPAPVDNYTNGTVVRWQCGSIYGGSSVWHSYTKSQGKWWSENHSGTGDGWEEVVRRSAVEPKTKLSVWLPNGNTEEIEL